MKFPKDLQLVGEKTILIPYKKEHVSKYHDWMEDPEILRLTGSERLSLDEEFKMQIEWEEDTQKCTFIIMDKILFEETKDEIHSIVGDTNLFFPDDCDSEASAEIEIMIAEKSARRKGFAREALLRMMKFGHEELKKNKFIAKIKSDNSSSIDLFTKLGFLQVSESIVFNEITFEYNYISQE